ncbi:putative kynurenine formamidase [Apostichopus japonicus]|uniref:Putative kynurenine formamidase n=1 Tax=Stichopus japonicus TaxID=307972 RepID=A0A2G8KNR1_STIJA|nr:putative kynurenine formamidase [Apostichopus japonicus]
MDTRWDIPKDEKGIPCVYKEWQNLDSQTLGDIFSPSRYSRLFNDRDECIDFFVKFLDEKSHKTRKLLKCEMNVPYGRKSNQTVDFYFPKDVKEDAPLLVYFHGGYWQFLSAASHGLVARHIVPHGAIVALVSYTIAPQGSLPNMIQECRDAVAFCAKRYPKSRGVVVGGHSAGGQLAAMMLATDWTTEYGLPHDLLKGACPGSGLFDLRPLVTTYINEPIGLNSETALDCSPVAYIPEIVKNSKHCKIRCIYGDGDPPSFEIQNQQFTQLLLEEGLDISCCKLKNTDHFEVVQNMWDENNESVEIILKLLFPELSKT